ncbi:MAG: hypothetical protein CMJ58_21830 [Planctomycetaceae bacterium]|nr:hypothetical protein [Planctomycetaceae bacterium]
MAALCLLALAGCDSESPVPAVPPPTARDDFQEVVVRLRHIMGETEASADVPAGAQPTRRQVTAADMQPAADGRPATAKITIRTVPAHAAPLVSEVLAGAETAGDDPDADDLAAAETTVGDEPQAVEVTYRLTHGDDGWRLDETPTDEVERLWFEYALVLP